MKSLQSFALAVASTAALVSALATAKPSFVVRIPNGANVPGVDAVGHVDPTGSSDSLNSFGKAFKSNRERWNVTLCLKDSDGDGQTNGQELDDPCCYWSSTNLVTNFTTGISDPGNSKSRVGEVSALSGGLSCCGLRPVPDPGDHCASASHDGPDTCHDGPDARDHSADAGDHDPDARDHGPDAADHCSEAADLHTGSDLAQA